MSALSINPPFPVFPDLDGQPLEDGYIWIGVAGLNPLTNPIVVYWDAALTIPAPQPIRTIGGFPARAGSPARLYANSDYSIQVQNKNGSVTYSSANATELLSSALVTFIQAGAGAVQRTAQSKMREMVSVFDFMTAAQISDVSSGTGAIDVSAAIISAIASFPNLNGFPNIYDNASTLFFPPGKYYCGQTIFINKTIRLLGAAGADIGNNFSATTLEFAANVHGFIVNQWNSAGATGSGNGTIFENLSIIQKQTAGRTVGRGIWSKARCTIKFCAFFYWAEAGIYFDASAGSGGQSEGNANCFSIEYSVSSANLGHGIYLNGADVNAGRIIGVDCSNNGGWGIWDSSFLGNTYFGCHTDNNTSGGYQIDSNNNNRSVFIGCYSENNQPPSNLQSTTSMFIGGLNGPGFTPLTSAKRFDDGGLIIGDSQLLRGTNSSSSQWELFVNTGLNPVDFFTISCASGGAGLRRPGIAFRDDFFSSQGGQVPPAVYSSNAGTFGSLEGGSTNTLQQKTRLDIKGGNLNGFDVSFSSDKGATYAVNLTLDSSGNFFSGFDNTKTLGSATNRWSVVYAGTPAINTSDEREKQQRSGGIDPAVLRAWEKVEYSQFKFNDAIDKKGDGARWHIGVIAQRVKEAFESEGLDAFSYGLLCYDKWEDEYATKTVEKTVFDENGNESLIFEIVKTNEIVRHAGDRYGIRYEEALALECAYLRSKLASVLNN